MTSDSPIFTDIDYEKAGKQVGQLYLPHSVTRSAYGNIAIPICVVKNGAGPTIALSGGNHGDEYEGQVALTKLIRVIDPGEVQGRLIVLPALNTPAALAGTRVSPVDGGNLNRLFPGDPEGGPTEKIAHYLTSVVWPLCDAMQDFHAGGASLDYIPYANMHVSGDDAHDAKALAALRAFGAPITMIHAYSLGEKVAQRAANKLGVISIGGEFGGRGVVNPDGVRLVEAGLRRVLAHFHVMELPPGHPPPAETRFMEVRGRDYYTLSPAAGLFEPFVRLGDTIKSGQPAGQVHFVDDPGREPVACHFKTAGMVICQRNMGRVVPGDCVFHLATDRTM